MGQHVEESLDQLLVLQDKAGMVRPRPEVRLAWRAPAPRFSSAPAPYRCLWGGSVRTGEGESLGRLVGFKTPQTLFAINSFLVLII